MSEVNKNLGHATAYGYAKSKGYSGTEEQFAEVMADVANVAQRAEDAADVAVAAKIAAETAAGNAEQSATDAETARTAAETARGGAETARTAAEGSATAAAESATQASGSATQAASSATNAAASATAAGGSATAASAAQSAAETAQGKAEEAQGKAEEAQASAEQAEATAEWYASRVERFLPTDTASGSIASFSDGADGVPVQSVVVSMTPQQDLHGQDAPYPAGGGKNKLPIPVWFEAGHTETSRGVTFTVQADGGVKVQGTNTGGGYSEFRLSTYTQSPQRNIFYVDEGDWTVSVVGSSSDVHLVVSGGNNNGFPYTDLGATTTYESGTVTDATKPFNYFIIRVMENATVNTTIYIQLEQGTTPTAWSPYENICPISGWDGGTAWGTGRNLLNPDWSAYSHNNSYSFLNGVVPQGQTARFTFADKDTSVSIAGINVGFVKEDVTASSAVNYRWAITSQGVQPNTSNISSSGAVCSNVLIYPSTKEAFDALFARYYIMVELGTDAHDYAPYTGDSYHSDFPSTVYGGTWSVTEGEIADKYGMVDLGTLNWNHNSDSAQFYVSLSDLKTGLPGGSTAPLVCEAYATGKVGATRVQEGQIGTGTSDGISSTTIIVGSSAYADAVSFKEAMQGVMLCYELAIPTTLSVDPHTVPSQLGANNIWSDTGETAVTYKADVQLYIDKRISEAVSALS